LGIYARFVVLERITFRHRWLEVLAGQRNSLITELALQQLSGSQAISNAHPGALSMMK